MAILLPAVVRHQVPIGQMGNYQEYLKKMNPLREVDETGGQRTQLFGNPYKLERSADKVIIIESRSFVLIWGIAHVQNKNL